jgi:hypothetical protein
MKKRQAGCKLRNFQMIHTFETHTHTHIHIRTYMLSHTYVHIYTGLFISPSGISGLCSTITKTDTAERSVSTDIESLQVCVLLYRCSISTPDDAADVNPVIQFLPHTLQHPMVDSSHFSTQLPSSGTTRMYAVMTHYALGEFLCLLVCSFLLCLSWLLYYRVRKSRRDLRITLYFVCECNATLNS